MREIARLYMDVVYLEMMLSQITYRTFNVGSVSLFLAQIHSLLEKPRIQQTYDKLQLIVDRHYLIHHLV